MTSGKLVPSRKEVTWIFITWLIYLFTYIETGMMTSAKGQFQFDGNAGILAVVHEMLLQSHISQVRSCMLVMSMLQFCAVIN